MQIIVYGYTDIASNEDLHLKRADSTLAHSTTEEIVKMMHLYPAGTKIRVPAGGRIYAMGANGSQMWWRPLYAPDGVPQGAVSTKAGGQPKDVLVVEDEAYLCDLIADVLESDGHTTRKAANGREALTLLDERKPQLILLDLMMPIMDGWEFMTQLQAHAEWASIPVIIITAIYDARRTQQETGARAVITKPFDIDQLTELVNLYAA